MTTLSARSSLVFKYGFPFVVILGASAWTYWSDLQKGEAKSPWVFVAVVVVLSVIAVVVFRRGPWSVADAVEYSGDAIHVKRFRTTETIPLNQIKDIAWAKRLVSLELAQPNTFGSSIRFYAPTESQAPGITATLEAISARVRAGR